MTSYKRRNTTDLYSIRRLKTWAYLRHDTNAIDAAQLAIFRGQAQKFRPVTCRCGYHEGYHDAFANFKLSSGRGKSKRSRRSQRIEKRSQGVAARPFTTKPGKSMTSVFEREAKPKPKPRNGEWLYNDSQTQAWATYDYICRKVAYVVAIRDQRLLTASDSEITQI